MALIPTRKAVIINKLVNALFILFFLFWFGSLTLFIIHSVLPCAEMM